MYASGLEYDEKTRSVVPVPSAENGLATAIATHLKKICEKPHELEGATFDNDGNLYFCEGVTNKILKLDANNHFETVAQFEGLYQPGLPSRGAVYRPDFTSGEG